MISWDTTTAAAELHYQLYLAEAQPRPGHGPACPAVARPQFQSFSPSDAGIGSGDCAATAVVARKCPTENAPLKKPPPPFFRGH